MKQILIIMKRELNRITSYNVCYTKLLRFEAVLNSTPEPVMVFDEFDRLYLINPAAKQLTGLVRSAVIGLTIEDVIENSELLKLVKTSTTDRDTSRDIQLNNNRFYHTTRNNFV